MDKEYMEGFNKNLVTTEEYEDFLKNHFTGMDAWIKSNILGTNKSLILTDYYRKRIRRTVSPGSIQGSRCGLRAIIRI